MLSELNAGSLEIATLLTMIALGVLVIMAVATGLITKLLFSPLARLAGVTRDVADGNLAVEIGSQNRGDEIGTMAKALARFKQSLVESRELEAASNERRTRQNGIASSIMAQREAEARSTAGSRSSDRRRACIIWRVAILPIRSKPASRTSSKASASTSTRRWRRSAKR